MAYWFAPPSINKYDIDYYDPRNISLRVYINVTPLRKWYAFNEHRSCDIITRRCVKVTLITGIDRHPFDSM